VADEFVVVGPSNAGKTALVAALQRAALHRLGGDHESPDVSVRPANEETIELFDLAARTIREGGALPVVATSEPTEYLVDVTVRRRGWRGWFAGPQEARFTLIDGPGGALFDEGSMPLVDVREELLAALRRARGLLLCVDATDEERCEVLFRALPNLFARMGLREMPYERVAIALTKADALAAHQGTRALRTVATTCPWQHAWRLLTTPGVNALRSFRGQAQLAVGFLSVYGFLDDGRANYDPARDGLRIAGDDVPVRDAIEAWRPYQVLDPFVYLATGLPVGLRIVRGL
jgi:hypothetical protein